MDDQSAPAESTEARVQAAIKEYLERVDRGEAPNREEFVAGRPDIAQELRSFIDAEEQLQRLAGAEGADRRIETSTQSFALHGQETIAPRAGPTRPAESETSGLKQEFGRYRIVRALGKGAMGMVYLAEDTQLQRQVALKTPHFEQEPTSELLERFYREARAAATLRHPNICPVYDVGQIDGTHYISMAFIEGHPLSAFIRSSKPQPERQILIVVRKLAQALQEAHDHGVVHRDLKPANIMVDKRNEPIIMDFGLARQLQRDKSIRLTQSGMLIGTPAYMSPEQIDGEPDRVGPPSDQYSLGVILYELLTGQLPFRGSLTAVMAQILTKETTPPSQLRSALDLRIEAACLKMMAKDPANRFASLSAAAEEFAAILRNPSAKETSNEPAAPAAAATPPESNVAASGIRQSGVKKSMAGARQSVSLAAQDLVALEELARKCLARHDYDQVAQIIERIPEEQRSAGLAAVWEKARAKADEVAFLVCEIDEAVRFNDRQTALKKADELVAIKPGHHRALKVREQFSGYGGGGAARLGPLRQFAQPWDQGGWIPWSVLACGLAVFGVMTAIVVIYLNGTAIEIDIKDPDVAVTVIGKLITITGPKDERVVVEPGEQRLEIRYAGLETVTTSFSIKKGEKKLVTVSIFDGQIMAKLAQETSALPLSPQKPTAANKGPVGIAPGIANRKTTAIALSKEPAPAKTASDRTAGVSSTPGFVPLFNGRDLAGWKTHPSQPGDWRVENGILIGSGPARSHLYTERGDFKDFHLRVEARINDGGNSGVYFRSIFGPGWPARNPTWPYGYEAQIDSTVDEARTGSLYAGGRAVRSVHDAPPAGAWFTEEVIAIGNHIVIKVNGLTTTDYIDEKQISASGHIALQQNNPQTVAEFRKIEIQELAPATAPTESANRDDAGLLVAPFDESTAKAAQQEWSDRLKTPVEMTNTIKMRLRLIPPGRFRMGSDSGGKDMRPAHDVRITHPLYFGTYEVTKGDFDKFVAATRFKTTADRSKGGWRLDNSSKRVKWEAHHKYTWRHPGFDQEKNHPVVDVTWDDVRVFCDWLSRKEGKTYRLPTEAEWEYACRAGTTGRTYNGNDQDKLTEIGNVADATAGKKFPAWAAVKSSDGWVYTSPMGRFRANNFGLYDTLGNAGEWCSDFFDKDYYKNSPVNDPPGPPAGDSHVGRGGSFNAIPAATFRGSHHTDHHGPHLGFRVVCEIPQHPTGRDTETAASATALPTAVSPAVKPPRTGTRIGDRRAAEAVLSLGGTVTIRVNGREHSVGPGKTLPSVAFRLTRMNLADAAALTDAKLQPLLGLAHLIDLNLHNAEQITDAGLEPLEDLHPLERLDLSATSVSDAGLAHLERLTRLKFLSLGKTRITGAGLAHLQGLTNLEVLWVNQTNVDDAGLASVRHLTKLRSLLLWQTNVTDAGLVHLEALTQLDGLMLGGAPLTDAGLVHIESLRALKSLWLDATQVTDAGLVHLRVLSELRQLNLRGTNITDAGLAHLEGLKNLKELELRGTKVTAAGVEKLKRSLPACRITAETAAR